METSVLEGWNEFFVMTGGAAAALGGLFIVAMSVNIKEILAGPSLTARAGATIAALMLVVVVAAIGLVPHQPDVWVGIEILLGSLVLWAFTVPALVRVFRNSFHAGPPVVRALRALLLLLPAGLFTLGAVLVTMGVEAGMALVCGAVIATFAASMVNAWILLVEVLR